MKVLGISGSPRKNGTTARLVNTILDESGMYTEFISLAGKKIGPCIYCLACAKDNVCRRRSLYAGWPETGDTHRQPDQPVFRQPLPE